MVPLSVKIRDKLTAVVFPALFRVKNPPEMVRLGTDYGGWWIRADLPAGSICYCAGVGEDASFDLALAARGCTVVSIDPTPRAISYVEGLGLPSSVQFVPVGLGGSDRVARFYAPADPAHVSHSITNLQGTADYFEAPIETVETIRQRLGHDRIDLLKLDIEGAHHEVLDALPEPLPRVLCVEYDQPEPWAKSRRSARDLARLGYRVAKVEQFNVTFVL